jgi:hypothetical protein
MSTEQVVTILEREKGTVIKEWLSRVEQNEELTAIPLNTQDRTGHLPLLLSDLVHRLRRVPHVNTPVSRCAGQHGILRREQRYTVAMLVEESRILQVSIFHTLQASTRNLDFSTVLLDVMVIADEVDSQLKQTVLGFLGHLAAKSASLPA